MSWFYLLIKSKKGWINQEEMETRQACHFAGRGAKLIL